MKYILTLIISICLYSMHAQIVDPTIVVVDSPCQGYLMSIDGNDLPEESSCHYPTPNVEAGTTYTLKPEIDPNLHLLEVTTLDLVIVQKGLLEGFESDLDIYKADFDQDGAVSTYDLVAMRASILGLGPQPDPKHRIIRFDEDVPTIDPFDIQVDYTTTNFTLDDYISNELNKLNNDSLIFHISSFPIAKQVIVADFLSIFTLYIQIIRKRK